MSEVEQRRYDSSDPETGAAPLLERPSLSRRIASRLKDLVVMIFAVFFLRTFVVQAYQIPSGSMENTLLVGDFLIANKFIYGPAIPFSSHKIPGRTPKRGEIVIFRAPTDNKDYIKRVIALPGEEIQIRDNVVFIDGAARRFSAFGLAAVNFTGLRERRHLCRNSKARLCTPI